MCRSADMHLVDRDKIKIRAFCVKLTLANNACTNQQRKMLLPDSLTLVYLPRISGSGLDIDGSKIRPDSPAFVTLHRVIGGGEKGAVAYASRERVRAGEGVRYEVCLGDVKLLNGSFRRDEDEEWRMGCRCLLEEEVLWLDLAEAEVCVAAEGIRAPVCEKVEMVVRPKRRRKVMGLEEIPEAKEEECGCCWCCGESDEEESGGDGETAAAAEEAEMESVGWAVDLGLWVMCLGVGLLVSKASSKRFRRRKLI